MALYDPAVAADAVEDGAGRRSRFELAPPRHFVLPAILMLLSEEPSYGYRLVTDIEELGFGRIDRPVIYRALGQLERDALVESWSEGTVVGRIRRVYGMTPLGARVLRSWIHVIRQHRDALDGVLRRYQSCGAAPVNEGVAVQEGSVTAACGHVTRPAAGRVEAT